MHDRLYDKLCQILDDMERKDKLSASDVQIVDWATHAKKSMLAVEEMEGGDSGSYRGGYDGYSRARNRRRDSMGRYSSDGYSRAGEMAERMRSMAADAPDEQTRREMERVASKLEQM